MDVTLAYDATRNVLVSRANTTSTSNPLSKFTYTVNDIGQRTNVATTGSAFGSTPSNSDRAWQYDAMGQVIASNSTGTTNDRAYSYDSIGNRKKAQSDATTIPGTPTAGTTSYTANGANQYSSITVGTGGAISPAPVNDADGNMTTGPVTGAAGLTTGIHAPASATLKWDAENRLIQASVGGTTVDYAYDHLSRLIKRTQGGATTYYLYDGWNRIAEYSGTTLSKVYTWGLDLSGTSQGADGVGGLLSILDISSGFRYYPSYDGNGNVSEYYKYILDSDPTISGNQTVSDVAAHFEYDPFGNLTADTGGHAADFPFRFSSKPQDPLTGLLYYGYRWYDPLTGRWPSRDPIEEEGGINLYGFVGNDGLNRWDNFGRYASVLIIQDFSGSADDQSTLNSYKNDLNLIHIPRAVALRKELENMTDQEFDSATENGIFGAKWTDDTGEIVPIVNGEAEAELVEVQVSRSELIQWMLHEESSSVTSLQTGGSLTPNQVFNAIRNLPPGREEYLFDTAQVVIHGISGRGARYGGVDDRIPFDKLRNVLGELHYFESRALSSCGANQNLYVKGRIMSEKHRWDGNGPCTLVFTPVQAGHDLSATKNE